MFSSEKKETQTVKQLNSKNGAILDGKGINSAAKHSLLYYVAFFFLFVQKISQ